MKTIDRPSPKRWTATRAFGVPPGPPVTASTLKIRADSAHWAPRATVMRGPALMKRKAARLFRERWRSLNVRYRTVERIFRKIEADDIGQHRHAKLGMNERLKPLELFLGFVAALADHRQHAGHHLVRVRRAAALRRSSY